MSDKTPRRQSVIRPENGSNGDENDPDQLTLPLEFSNLPPVTGQFTSSGLEAKTPGPKDRK